MIQIDKPMPDGCDVCPLMYDYIQCNALPEGCKDDDAFNEEGFDWTKRPKWCPLKEQDAKPPAIMQDIEGIWSTCSMCGHKLRPILAMEMDLYFPKFCSECGQAVKWE